MITDVVLRAIEERLDTIVEANVVPEGEAYPTSGSKFYRVTGDHTDFVFKESSIVATVSFSVICSIRTRDYLKQKKDIPYVELLNMQESCFFHLITYGELENKLRETFSIISVNGRIQSEMMNTRVQNVFPIFFNSKDKSSDREAGYLISQSFHAPSITIPYTCLTLPSEFDPI